MITIRLLLFSLLLLLSPGMGAASLSYTLRDTDGVPLAGITIRAISTDDPSLAPIEAVTNENGWFSLELPDGNWQIVADEAETLAQGYFCAPAIGGVGVIGGVITVPFPAILNFIAVRLRPEITPVVRNGLAMVELDFEWLSIVNPSVLRSYRVERSTDLQNWSSLGTVLLSNPPVRILDPSGQVETGSVYYRAVEAESFRLNTTSSNPPLIIPSFNP